MYFRYGNIVQQCVSKLLENKNSFKSDFQGEGKFILKHLYISIMSWAVKFH